MKRLFFALLAVIAVEFSILRAAYSLFRVMIPYICGALTELSDKEKDDVKKLYVDLANTVAEVLGQVRRPFVPHEHYDPEKAKHYTPFQVFVAEVFQVMFCTSRLIVVTRNPSWGGGMEVMMAIIAGVPVDLLCERGKLEKRLISRLVRGGPGVSIIEYEDGNDEDAVIQYRGFLRRIVPQQRIVA